MDSSVRNSWPVEDSSPPPLPPRGNIFFKCSIIYLLIYSFLAPERRTSDAPPLPRRLPLRRVNNVSIAILVQNDYAFII